MIFELENGTKVEPINLLCHATSKRLIDELAKIFTQITGFPVWVGISQSYSNYNSDNGDDQITILPCRIVDSKINNKQENIQQ